jgi:hypothetical protein
VAALWLKLKRDIWWDPKDDVVWKVRVVLVIIIAAASAGPAGAAVPLFRMNLGEINMFKAALAGVVGAVPLVAVTIWIICYDSWGCDESCICSSILCCCICC